MIGVHRRARVITIGVTVAVIGIVSLDSSVNTHVRVHFPQYDPLLRPQRAQGPGPLFYTSVNMAAVRRAIRILPPNARYLIYAPAGTPTVASDDLRAAGYLTFLPALPVSETSHATWILSYRSGTGPPGAQIARRYSLGGDLYLMQLQARKP